jgi:uncharacterized protein (TIGR00661 family)
MKKIIYYITDHGRGHATRSVALIRNLQKFNIDITIRNSNNIQFLQKSLDNVPIVSGTTDVGPLIRRDGISIDNENSQTLLHDWMAKLEKNANLEIDRISKISPNLIISDISAMPLVAAKKLQIPSIAISNFTWFDVLKFLSRDDLEMLRTAYDNADLAIKLPLGTEMSHFKNRKQMGIVSRSPTKSREELRRKLGIKDSTSVVLVVIGNSSEKLEFPTDADMQIISLNSNIKSGQNVQLLTDWVEGQDLVHMSDLVICKCGYGVVSECLSNGVPFFYLFDEEHLEQKAISKELQKLQKGTSITYDKLRNYIANDKLFPNAIKYEKSEVDNHNVSILIKELIKN